MTKSENNADVQIRIQNAQKVAVESCEAQAIITLDGFDFNSRERYTVRESEIDQDPDIFEFDCRIEAIIDELGCCETYRIDYAV